MISLLGVVLGSCDPAETEATGGVVSATADTSFVEAQVALGEGRLNDARSGYADVLRRAQDPSTVASASDRRLLAQAHVAHAVTGLLLLPETPAATTLFTVLGADPTRLPLDAEAALYGEDGPFAVMRSGGSTSSVEDALYAALPWPDADLRAGPEAVFAHVEPGTTLEALRPGVLLLDEELAAIEDDLERALDLGLVAWDTPTGMLRSPRSYRIRRSEVLTFLSTLRSARTALQLVLAYDWSTDLRAALGGIDENGAPILARDRAAMLDGVIGRALTDQSVASRHLANALTSAVGAIDAMDGAIAAGRDEARGGLVGPIEWLIYDDAQARDLRTVFDDVRAGLASDTPIAFSLATPELAWTAAPLFAGSLARDSTAPPLVVAEPDPLYPDDPSREVLALSDVGVRAFVVEPLFEPAWSPDSPPNLLGESSLADTPTTTVTTRFQDEIVADYNL